MPKDQVKTVKPSAEVVDKYAGKTKKEFIEMKIDELKKTSKSLTQKEINDKADHMWKEYSAKADSNKKKQAKQAKDDNKTRA